MKQWLVITCAKQKVAINVEHIKSVQCWLDIEVHALFVYYHEGERDLFYFNNESERERAFEEIWKALNA